MQQTIKQCLTSSGEQLAKISLTPRLDTEVLLAHVLEKTRSYLHAHSNDIVSAAQQLQFNGLLQKRLQGEPIAYIVGHCEFWSLDLLVNQHTLIPRPETELLVELALQQVPENQQTTVLDLGTGSGAIALAIASERKHSQIIAVDKSAQALAVAQQNAEHLHIANIKFQQSDWLSELSAIKFDLIVANPPYVAENDSHLLTGDVRFEPNSALVAKENGFAAIKYIIDKARAYLKTDAYLMLEHGYDQALQVQQYFKVAGYNNINSYRDLSNIERVTMGCLKN